MSSHTVETRLGVTRPTALRLLRRFEAVSAPTEATQGPRGQRGYVARELLAAVTEDARWQVHNSGLWSGGGAGGGSAHTREDDPERAVRASCLRLSSTGQLKIGVQRGKGSDATRTNDRHGGGIRTQRAGAVGTSAPRTRPAHRLCHRIGGRTGLMSITGVPSIASSGPTVRVRPPIERMVTW